MMVNRRQVLVCGLSVFWIAVARATDQQLPATVPALPRDPNIDALVKSSARTRQRISSESCSWRTRIDLENGAYIETQVLRTPQARCTTINLTTGDVSREVYQIIERDGLQYVKQFGKPLGKFRPYEAPLCSPSYQFYIELAEPLFVSEQMLREAMFEGTSGSVIRFRVQVPETTATQLRNMVQSIEQMHKRASAEPGYYPDLKAQKRLTLLKELLEKGKPVDIDTSLGIVRRMLTPAMYTATLEEPRFEAISPDSLRTTGIDWEDHSGDPTDDVDPNDLVMIGNDGVWQPGRPPGDTECRLMNVRTGQFRRVPFKGTQCIPACFLKGRNSVVVLGMESLKGTVLGLFEVNLRTGENRRLGGELLKDRFCFGAALSPDGRSLAVITSTGTLASEVCLVDPSTNDAHILGQCHSMSLSWTPDGTQLILDDLVDHGPGRKPRVVVCRMDLHGKLSIIGDGHGSCLLGDGKTILFQNGDDIWHTCDLGGRNVVPYAQGMPAAKHPALSPDGRRILWMCPERGRLVPRISEVGSSRLSSITNASGYWDRPQWR